MRYGLKFITLICALIISQSLAAAPLRIAVAANFKSPLTDLVSRYQDVSTEDTTIDIIPGATGALTTQIIQGAPFDILFAANRAGPEKLERLALTRYRQTYAVGQLVFWTRNETVGEEALTDFSGTLAIANPRHAPYGQAATEVLESLSSRPTLILGNNVAQTFTFVQTGNAGAGLVSLSQVLDLKVSSQHYRIIPHRYHAPIEQQLVVMKTAPGAATRFVAWLMEPEARLLVEAAGYTLPASGHD